MDKSEKLEQYYQQDSPFKAGIDKLRKLAKQTDCAEDFKWKFPVYTVNGKNVFGICRFKNHFGIWFFNGVFLSDPGKVLENAQEGKTKGMRHWKFRDIEEIDDTMVLEYIKESIANQKEGKEIQAEKKATASIPELLDESLKKDTNLKVAFETFSPYKQKEFCEYIEEAKQEKTKLRRLEKILPMIQSGTGLNDAYR